jgi:hypothetical protein
MAKIYSKNALVLKSMKPKRNCFLLNYSKALTIVKADGVTTRLSLTSFLILTKLPKGILFRKFI